MRSPGYRTVKLGKRVGFRLFDGEMVFYLSGISPHPLPRTRKRRNLVLI
jgi:hypothetical protein